MNKPVIIIGNGGHAAVITEILIEQNRTIIGFTAPEKQKNEFGLIYLGKDEIIETYNPEDIEIVNGMGSVGIPEKRKEIFNYFKSKNYFFVTVIHPSAILLPSVQLSEGNHVMAGVIIQTGSIIRENTILNTAVSVDHHCYIAEHCHLAPRVTLSGSVKVGVATHIGTGSTVIQNIEIGSSVMIGAGSLIIRNLKDASKAFGVPAKEV